MDFNLLDYPLALHHPRHLPVHDAWIGHIPFAFTLVQMMRPETIVELGVYQGGSYCGFCQAVAELQLRATRCFGIDTWKGDEHTGETDESILEWLRAHHDPLYSAFSQFVQADFDTAAAHVAEREIDLLHIDGLHTYEAVRHDFETWLPKMSDRGVILFHDTAERQRDFGVWRLWEEIGPRYPSFAFEHSHGLGVLAVGANVAPAVLDFIADANRRPAQMRRMFEALAERVYSTRHAIFLSTFVNGAQRYLDNWKRRIGQTVDDVPFDAATLPAEAAERAERDIKALAALLSPPPRQSPPPPQSPPPSSAATTSLPSSSSPGR